MDIIVTTPKSEMATAAKEAEEVKKNNGGYYFRFFGTRIPNCYEGDKVFYVENDIITGYCVVYRRKFLLQQTCDTTGKVWDPGFYLFMDATTWQWIFPIEMKGFRGFRYLPEMIQKQVRVVGDWRDERPNILLPTGKP